MAVGPDSAIHNAFKREWSTADDIRWKHNFGIRMTWIRAFHGGGGLLMAGSDDSGIAGITLIRALALLQKAGVHPIT